MVENQNEEKLLRAVAVQNARAILLARERAERALRESEERLRVTLASIGDAVIVSDTKGRVTYLNPVAEELTGWAMAAAAEAPLEEVFRIVDEQTRQPVQNPCVRVLSEGVVVGLANHTVLIARDGTERTIDDSAAPIRDVEGNITGVILIFRDVTEKRQSERALQDSEEFSRTVLEDSPDCVRILDLEGRVQFMNANGLRLLDIDDFSAVKNQLSWTLWPEESQPLVQGSIQKALRSETASFQAFCPTAKGRPKWWDVIVRPVMGENGKPARVISVARDITESKATQEALRQNELFLRLQKRSLEMLVRGSPLKEVLEGMVCAMEAQSPRKMMAAVHLLSKDGSRFEDAIAPSLPQSYRAATEGMKIDSKTGPCCWAALTGDRVIVPDVAADAKWKAFAEFMEPLGLRSGWSAPIISSQNKVLGTFAHYYFEPGDPNPQDLQVVEVLARTMALAIERKQDEEAKARLAAIIESSDDAIISKDLNGIITTWNRGAERLFGYEAAEAIGRSVTMLIPPERLDEEPRILERIRRGDRIEHYETVRRRKNGTLIHISLTVSPMRNSQNQVIGASKIARDITERKRAEELLQSQAKHLESLVQERTAKLQATIGELEAFSYSVSHDLRAPLRAMAGYAKALLEEAPAELAPQHRTYLERIQRAAERLDRLTQEILTYSQLSRCEIKLQPVNLDKLAHEIVEQYPELTAHCGHVQIRSPLLPVLAHESLLTQALSNLLNNACKFVAPGTVPKVVVRTEAIGEEIRIWVEDSGIGIAPEHRDRLFKIFGRIHPDSKYEGTGIGLAIVKKAGERMNGTTGFESEPGKGSKFWVQLKKAGLPS